MWYIDKKYLKTQFDNFSNRIASVFARKTDIPTKTSQLENDSGFKTEESSGSVDVLDTMEEIEANTTAGKVAGALAVKELNSSLAWYIANGYLPDPSKITFLYNSGDQCVDITGGWAGLVDAGYTTNGQYPLGNGVINTDNMYFAISGRNRVGVGIKNSIDFTNYSKLHIVYESSGDVGSNSSRLDIYSSKNIDNQIVSFGMNHTSGQTEGTLDVSSLNGNYYIVTQLFYSSGLWGKIHKMWLE